MQTAMNELRENILTSVLLSTQTKTIVCAFIDNHLEKENVFKLEFAKGLVEWVESEGYTRNEIDSPFLMEVGKWRHYSSPDILTTDQLIEIYIKTL